MMYGRGAGKLPTASAVLGDVIETAKGGETVLSQTWESADDASFIDSIDNLRAKWYFRVSADSEVNVEGAYTYDDGISFITDTEYTFAEARKMAVDMKASAFYPVLD